MNICLVSFCTLRRAETQGAAAAVPALKVAQLPVSSEAPKNPQHFSPQKKEEKKEMPQTTLYFQIKCHRLRDKAVTE